MSEPSHWPKTFFETARTLVFGIAGFFAVRCLTTEDKRVEMANGQRMEVRRVVIDDFAKSSYRYTAITYDIVKGNGSENEDNWGKAYGAFKSDSQRLTIYFDGLDEGLKKAEKMAADIKEATRSLAKMNPNWPNESEERRRKGYCPDLDNPPPGDTSCVVVKEGLEWRRLLKELNDAIVKEAIKKAGISPSSATQ